MTIIHSKNRYFLPKLYLYIIKEVLLHFLSGLVIFSFLLLFFQAIRLSEIIISHHVEMIDIVKIAYGLWLSFIPISMNLAFLFSIVVTSSHLTAQGEMLALQISGVRLVQIFFPIAIFALFFSMICLYLSMFEVPRGNRKFEVLVTTIGNKHIMSALKPKTFISQFFGFVFYADEYDVNTGELTNVLLSDERNPRVPMNIFAHRGLIIRNMNKIILRLTNGSIISNKTDEREKQEKIDFDIYEMNLTQFNFFSHVDYSPPSYTYNQIHEALSKTDKDSYTYRELLCELYRRFSISFVFLPFSCIAFFIGLFAKKGNRSVSFFICLVLSFFYWVLFIGSNALSLNGSIPAWLGSSLANIFFSLFAFFAFEKFKKL